MTQPNLGTPDSVTDGGTEATAVATNTTVQIKATTGRLHRIIVTGTPGAGSITAYDNNTGDNTGTVLGVVPASAAIGAYTFQTPAQKGITVISAASAPACTVTWS